MAASPPKESPKPLHPVYTVTNIQNKVRVLDGTKVSYSSRMKLFMLHARGYKVLHHIDGTAAPDEADPTYASWLEIDSIVLQWIYGTMSDDLLVRILEPDSTAYEAWTRIQNIFLNNKGSRAAALEHEFTNLTLKSMSSLDAYCQRLKELAAQLTDVDNPVTDNRLVLQLVRGLPTEYDTVASYINQTLPAWETAVSMLQLEHHRQTARESLASPPIAAVATANPPPEPSYTRNTNRQPNRNPSRNNPRNNGPRRENPRPTPPHPSVWPPWWQYPPPCPYPTQQGWATPWTPPPTYGPPRPSQPPSSGLSRRHQQPSTPQAHFSGYDPLDPTQLGEAFSTMTLDPPDSSGTWTPELLII